MANYVERFKKVATDQVATELANLNRTLKEILYGLKTQNLLIKTMVHGHIEVNRKTGDAILPPVEDDKPVVIPPIDDPKLRTYGWSMAASVQREGGLIVGDMKIEQDNSIWVWNGDSWERLEAPSGKT